MNQRAGEPPKCRECGKPVRLRADDTAGRHDRRTPAGLAVPCDGSYRPPAGDPPCLPTCRPAGTVGWPHRYVQGQPHASTYVCDSPSHQEQASAWVESLTGHAGVFRTFETARRAS